MKNPRTPEQFLDLVLKSGLLTPQQIDRCRAGIAAQGLQVQTAIDQAQLMVFDRLLTNFQARYLLLGKWRNFFVKGKFKVLERLGAGGQSSVMLCEHCRMQRDVALKLLPIQQAEAGQVQRFYSEARTISSVDHPNIVRIHDIDNDGQMHFIVMEHVRGVNLQTLVRAQGRLSIARAVNYTIQTLQGLQHAHEAGLVHRDIKPANLLIDERGTVKITDFGLANFQSLGALETKKSIGEGIQGTVDYISPEQATNPEGTDIRSDLYSLGATLRYLLLGETLFPDLNSTQKLIAHQMRVPTPTAVLRSEVPSELSETISRLLAKNPAERPSIPAAVIDELMPWYEVVPAPEINASLMIARENESLQDDTRMRREFATESTRRLSPARK